MVASSSKLTHASLCEICWRTNRYSPVPPIQPSSTDEVRAAQQLVPKSLSAKPLIQ